MSRNRRSFSHCCILKFGPLPLIQFYWILRVPNFQIPVLKNIKFDSFLSIFLKSSITYLFFAGWNKIWPSSSIIYCIFLNHISKNLVSSLSLTIRSWIVWTCKYYSNICVATKLVNYLVNEFFSSMLLRKLISNWWDFSLFQVLFLFLKDILTLASNNCK